MSTSRTPAKAGPANDPDVSDEFEGDVDYGTLIASQVFNVPPPGPGATVEELNAYTEQVNSLPMIISKLVLENGKAIDAVHLLTEPTYHAYVVDKRGNVIMDEEISMVEFSLNMLDPPFRMNVADGLHRGFIPDEQLWRGPNNTIDANRPTKAEEMEVSRKQLAQTDKAYTQRSLKIERHYNNRVLRALPMLANVEQKQDPTDLSVRQRLASSRVIRAYQEAGLPVPENIGTLIMSPLAAMDGPSIPRERVIMEILEYEEAIGVRDHPLIDSMSTAELRSLLLEYLNALPAARIEFSVLDQIHKKMEEVTDEEVRRWALNRDHKVVKTVRKTKTVFDEERGVSRQEIVEVEEEEVMTGHEFYANKRLQSMILFPKAPDSQDLDGNVIQGQYYVDEIVRYIDHELRRVLPPGMVAQPNNYDDEVILRDQGVLFDIMRLFSIDSMKRLARTQITECRIYSSQKRIMVDDKPRDNREKKAWGELKSKIEAQLIEEAGKRGHHLWLSNPEAETDEDWLEFVERRRSKYQKEARTPMYTVVVSFIDDDGDEAEITWSHVLPYVDGPGGYRQTAYRRFFGDLQLIRTILVSKCMNEADQDWALPGQFQTRVWEVVHQSNLRQKEERMTAAIAKYENVLLEDGSPKYDVQVTGDEILVRHHREEGEQEEWQPVRWERNVFETFSTGLNSGQTRVFVSQLGAALDQGLPTDSVPIEFQVGSANPHLEGFRATWEDVVTPGMEVTRDIVRGYPLAHDIITDTAERLVRSFQNDDIVVANGPHDEKLLEKFFQAVVRAYAKGFRGYVFALLPTNASWHIKPLVQQFWRDRYDQGSGITAMSTIYPHVIHTLPLPNGHTLEIGDVSTGAQKEGANTIYVLGPIGSSVTPEIARILEAAPASRETRMERQKESAEKRELKGGVDTLTELARTKGTGTGGYTQRGQRIRETKSAEQIAEEQARRAQATLEKQDSSWSTQRRRDQAKAEAKAAQVDEEGFTTKTKRRR